MGTIRSTVILWIQNIHKFIDEDKSYILHRSEEIQGGPKQEINWWSKRNLVLTKTYQTLNGKAYRGIISALEQDAEEEAERSGTALLDEAVHIDGGNVDGDGNSNGNTLNVNSETVGIGGTPSKSYN